MLVSVKKQRQKIWIDEETQPEDEVEIALDFVGSPYENQGLSPLGTSAHKERKECVPTPIQASSQNPSQAQPNTQSLESEPYDEEAQTLGAGKTNEVSEGGSGYSLPPPYAGVGDFVDCEVGTSQATKGQKTEGQMTVGQAIMPQGVKTERATTHEEEPLVLSPKGEKTQRNWRWALFSVLVHVVCVVAIYAFAQAVLQGKFNFIFDSDTPVIKEKMTQGELFQTLEGDAEESETARAMPATPADSKRSRPLVHMIDLEDVVPSQK